MFSHGFFERDSGQGYNIFSFLSFIFFLLGSGGGFGVGGGLRPGKVALNMECFLLHIWLLSSGFFY